MDVIIARLGPLIDELRLLRAEVTRLADLKELELNSLHGLTTRVVKAAPKDLAETSVQYHDPDYEAVVRELERRAGRSLSEEEVQRIVAASQDET